MEGQKGDRFYIVLRGMVTMHEKHQSLKQGRLSNAPPPAPGVLKGGDGLDLQEQQERKDLIESVLMGRVDESAGAGGAPRSTTRGSSIRAGGGSGFGSGLSVRLQPSSQPAAQQQPKIYEADRAPHTPRSEARQAAAKNDPEASQSARTRVNVVFFFKE